MINRYRCDICGCYLDPGEGRRCDECQQKIKDRRAKAGQLLKIETVMLGAELVDDSKVRIG